MTRIRRGTRFTAHLVSSSAETGHPRVEMLGVISMRTVSNAGFPPQ